MRVRGAIFDGLFTTQGNLRPFILPADLGVELAPRSTVTGTQFLPSNASECPRTHPTRPTTKPALTSPSRSNAHMGYRGAASS